MPAGTYVFTMYTISGSANGTFTVTGSFTVTVFDSDDDFGVGDDQTAGAPTETGAAPVISALGAGAPFGWDIGDTFYFGGARGLDAGAAEDIYIPKIGGAWQTTQALFSVPGASVPLVIGQSYSVTSFDNVNNETLPCFVSGTEILTNQGPVSVEDLKTGDCVTTMDHGQQKIRWIGSCTRVAMGNLAPILFRSGAIGNTRDLLVSPQHRMLVSGWQAELLSGETEVLVAAKAMISDCSIVRKTGGMVTYFHILFDHHEIIYAEGVPTESFHPSDKNIASFDVETRDEVLELFPDLNANGMAEYGPAARYGMKPREGEVLARMLEGEHRDC